MKIDGDRAQRLTKEFSLGFCARMDCKLCEGLLEIAMDDRAPFPMNILPLRLLLS